MRTVTLRTKVQTILAVVCLGMALVPAQGKADIQTPGPGSVLPSLEQEVRHQLILQPFYGVFDNLEFTVDGGQVTLTGQVVRQVLKIDAEKAVRRIPGVTGVTNQIELLPVSPNDDRIRMGVWREIYSQSSMLKYATQTVQPIHIIVKNGNVTLMGVVNNRADSIVADMAAKRVPGIFSVNNQLQTEHA